MTARGKKLLLAVVLIDAVTVTGVLLALRYHDRWGREADLAPSVVTPNEPESEGQPTEGEPPTAAPAKSVLRSALAGSWYSDNAEALRAQLKAFYQKAETAPRQDLIALILPHAGYSYSGQTAVAGIKTIGRQYDRIVVIGPSHSVAMEEIFSVPRVTHYETPLGQIPLDVEFISQLLEYPVFQNIPLAHQHEHSVQIEAPLLQFKDLNFKLVPIVAGDCSLETIRSAAAILRGLIDEQTLMVVSSDFVHYGASYGYVPFTDNIPEQIKSLDMGAFKFIEAIDGQGFLDYQRSTGATICGRVPIALLLSMLDKSSKVEMIEYATSGELEGDYSRSVSYLSIVFRGAWPKSPSTAAVTPDVGLEATDRESLLKLARATIAYALEKRRVPDISELGIEISETLRQPRGAFVTLKKAGRLRGCIGDIFPSRPLYSSVLSNAINAAFRDRRFQPLQKEELADISIEISALTRPSPVPSYESIRIGTDGMVLKKNGRSAVFLPQVAPEQGWNLDQTLTQLALKAGLEADDWKQGASFLVFQADVFGESEK